MFKKYMNRVNTKIGAVITQAGTLEGIENIKPQYVFFFIPIPAR
jgi:hypothetical protein